MTSASAKASQAETVALPWYDLIDDPEPPEDAMQQARTILDVMSVLQARYENDASTLWSTQTNVIYDSKVPGSVVAPDGYIVFGVDGRRITADRRSYRIDEWGPPPAFVLEVASESTASRDLREKREIYARMGSQEYWRMDRTGEYYGERLVGERLVSGEYEPFELHTEANGDVWSRSEVLGLDFYCRVDEDGFGRFSLRDSATGEWLNTLGPEIRARQVAEAQGQREREARRGAEAQAQGEREARRAAEAQAQREREARRGAEAQAQREREARQALEAREQELLAELERLRRQQG